MVSISLRPSTEKTGHVKVELISPSHKLPLIVPASASGAKQAIDYMDLLFPRSDPREDLLFVDVELNNSLDEGVTKFIHSMQDVVVHPYVVLDMPDTD